MNPPTIRAWLESLDLGHYTAAFEGADVTPDLCGTLSDDDLKELGVASLGHRRTLLTKARSAAAAPMPAAAVAPDWVGRLPTVLAVGVEEYFREPDPVLRLWHVCDVCELTLRLLAITGLSELRARAEGGGLPLTSILRDVRPRIELPTLGKWQGIAEAVAGNLGEDSPSAELACLVRQKLLPLLDGRPGEGPEWSLRQLRNQLAHGGGITKARARSLLERWQERLGAFVSALEVTGRMRFLVRTPSGFGVLQGVSATAQPWAPCDEVERRRLEGAFRQPGDVVLLEGRTCFGLWPWSLYAVPMAEGDLTRAAAATPQVYVRRGEVGLIYTPIGSPDASQHTSAGESVAEFERLLQCRTGATEETHGSFRIGDFVAQLERESQQLVGRVAELEVIREWLRSSSRRLGAVLGGAGTGKSLLMARVCADLMEERNRRGGSPEVLTYRFKGGDERCNRESFLTFVGERLAARLAREPGEGVSAITLVAGLVRETPGLLLVADGIDEIAERDPVFIEQVLVSIADAGARILCAGRPEESVRGPLDRASTEQVFPLGLPMMADGDIRTMILEKTGPLRRLFLCRDVDQGELVRNDAIERIIRAAGGLPLYVNYVIGDLLSRKLSLDALGQLPPTLAAYHERLLQRGQIGDLALVNTPLLATICLSLEPLTTGELGVFLTAWGVLAAEEDPRVLVERSLQAVETMVRRTPDATGGMGYLPYHHSLRQHVLGSREMRHAVLRARQTFRRLAVETGAGQPPRELEGYLLRQGAHHLAADGTVAETASFVSATWGRCDPLLRRRNLVALNLALAKDEGQEQLDPSRLFAMLVELHDGTEVAPGARALYLHHRTFLGTPEAAPLQLGFAITYELAAEVAEVERGRSDPAALATLRAWSSDHSCPAQYAACYALNYLFMREPGRVPPEVFGSLARSNPYDRMVALNALMYRALEGLSPFAWVADGPFWRSRWPYLARDAALVRACYAHAAGLAAGDDAEVEEIRGHLAAVDALARDLGSRPGVRGDAELVRLTDSHWLAVSDLRGLRRLRDRLVVHREWMDFGRLLLANPFWQLAGVGAEVLAERYRTSPSDRPAIDAMLSRYEPTPGTGLLGDRDLGMADLARLTLADERDPALIASRLGPFLASPSSHQRAEATLHITQLFRMLSAGVAERLLDLLRSPLERAGAETDIWALHERVELIHAAEAQGLTIPPELDVGRSPLLQAMANWKDMQYLRFVDDLDRQWETHGVRGG